MLVTTDAMLVTRDNARFLRTGKDAHYLWPVLGNQLGLYAALDVLDWENTPVRTFSGIGEQALGLQPDPGIHPVTPGR